MARFKITTLSPIHISSGEEYENNFNMLYNNGFVYIYDEFKLAQFFIAKNMEIPKNFDTLKQKIEKFKNEIIASNLHIRKIESEFRRIDKALLENISTAGKPIITGSSLKGSLRTAILDCLYERANDEVKDFKCETIFSKLRKKEIDENRFQKRGRNIEAFDKDFANLFKYLKVSDSLSKLDTKVYKTINMKKDEDYQGNRERKVKSLVNLVECIKPNQTFEVEITDISSQNYQNAIFSNLGSVCNMFYIPWYADELKNYFKAPTRATKTTFEKLKNLNNRCFIVNIGRFGGAERKSINNLRYIGSSKADDKTTTSARTYALERSANDEVYYEKELIPFGWILCEMI